MKNRGVFVTGTDTGVGKTTVSALLMKALKQKGVPARYYKPVQTGNDSDTQTVSHLAQIDRAELSDPAYQFAEPISPDRAASLNRAEISIARICELAPKNAFQVVEGAGGLLVPLNARETMRDLAIVMDLPLIIVASTRLGTINHTLLTIEAARHAGLELTGLILNGEEDAGLANLLINRTGVPLLAEIPRFTSEASMSDARIFTNRILEHMGAITGATYEV